MTPFALTDAERASPLWDKLAERFAQRIATLSVENERPQDAEATAMLRGRIAAYRELLSLSKPARTLGE